MRLNFLFIQHFNGSCLINIISSYQVNNAISCYVTTYTNSQEIKYTCLTIFFHEPTAYLIISTIIRSYLTVIQNRYILISLILWFLFELDWNNPKQYFLPSIICQVNIAQTWHGKSNFLRRNGCKHYRICHG